jgi:hypothetical protein
MKFRRGDPWVAPMIEFIYFSPIKSNLKFPKYPFETTPNVIKNNGVNFAVPHRVYRPANK